MTKLFDYQRDGIRRIHHFDDRVLLADSMGLGKSVQALIAGQKSRARPIVVVCPAGLKFHWENEAAVHCNARAEILSGTRPPRGGLMRRPALVIINYEILGPWMKYLKRLDPEMVIGDEIHYCKNRGTARTQNFQTLCTGVEKIILLSGTPLTNRPAELFPALNILWPKKFPSFTEFGFKYCKPELRFGKIEFKGAQNLDDLHRRCKRYGMIRRTKAEVLKELPPKRRIVQPMPIADARQYVRAEKEFISWLRENFGGRRAASAIYAERLVQMGYLKRLAAELKLPAVFDWLDSFLEESDEKIIVFGVHRKIIGACAERYAGQCVQVHGGVLGQHRQKAYTQFQKSDKCRILIGNEAAGVGWNGSCATTTAHIELPWTPGAVNQAGDRMHRIGQKKKTTEYFLVAKDTIESRLCRVLQEKQGVLNEVLDGGAGRGTVLNIYDQICGEFLGKIA